MYSKQTIVMFSLFARAMILVLVFITAHLVNQAANEVYIDGSKALKRDAGEGVAYANFAVHKFRYLNVTPLLSASVTESRECGKLCVDYSSCFSANLAAFRDQDGKIICELLPGDKYKNSNKFTGHQTFHHLSIKTPCYSNPCMNQATCVAKYEDHAYMCVCALGYSGKHCETAPVYSCNEILSKADGEYWINPEKGGNPLKVFCDMTTDGGGWLLVSNVVIDESSSSPQLSLETTYRGISNYNNNKTFLTTSAMHELRTHLAYTQLRFYCSKQQGPRTFHVTTVSDSIGEAVVEYFSGQTDVQPDACGSFVTMENDNSRLAGQCHLWGKENGVLRVGKWGHGEDQDRLFRYTVFNHANYYWLFLPDGSKVRCDDLSNAVSPGDFWKIFVR